MIKSKVLVTLSSRLLLAIFLPFGFVTAQTRPQPVTDTLTHPFELKNGDRVVFVGNSLFENDFQYGYLELALTTRWPDRDVTYRNLGWSGDNVFGVARSTITNPPTGYELLMEHLTKTKPTVVFVGYGGIEAEEGESGLPRFKEGLTKLIDKIDQLGARAVLLSPIPILSADSSQTKRNAMLQLYAATIAKTAAERSKRYIDLFKPIQEVGKTVRLTENGIHLNETGYYYLATTLEKSLGLPSRTRPVTITVSKAAATTSTPAKILDSGNRDATLTFSMDEPYLPLPPPVDKAAISDPGQIIKITGLKKGFYTLTAD
ncbi:MAG: family lipase, partial [Spirosoma sp.]|nr:family lipase [Spirosoma sp.]